MSEEIKIITLGDIFDNIETEEKAFRFIDYIKDLQQKVEQLEKEIDRLINLNKQLVEECQRLDDEETRLNNIINELEKELREGSFDVYFCSTNTQKTFKSNEIIIKSLILDKLKELKEE